MKGAYLLSLVMLIVLAIPLFADHSLVNPVGEFSAISTINNEEVPPTFQVLPYDHIAVLAVGIKKTYLYNINESKVDFLTGNDTNNVVRSRQFVHNNSKRGGNLRFASGH